MFIVETNVMGCMLLKMEEFFSPLSGRKPRKYFNQFESRNLQVHLETAIHVTVDRGVLNSLLHFGSLFKKANVGARETLNIFYVSNRREN